MISNVSKLACTATVVAVVALSSVVMAAGADSVRPVSGVSVAATAPAQLSPGLVHGIHRIMRADDSGLVSPPTVLPEGPGCTTSVSLTQSTDPLTVAPGSVACATAPAGQAACWTSDNAFARSYDLSVGPTAGLPFAIVCVDFGIESNAIGSNLCNPPPSGAGPKDVTVTIYQDMDGGAPGSPGTDLVALGSAVVTVPDGTTNQIFTATFAGPVVAPANSVIVVETAYTDSDPAVGGDGNVIRIGSNGLGQSAPSYLLSAPCGLATYSDIAAIGFPAMHLVQTVHGELPGLTGACCDDLTSTCTDTPPVDITNCNGSRFLANSLCTDLVPPCGAVAGCGNGVCDIGEDCLSCPADCGACVCGNGVLEPGEECDPGGILGAPPDDAACPGTCLADCTCALVTCTATCPPGAVDELETCGTDVNGGCNSGTCTGDGSACSPLNQDCAVGMGPCLTTPASFTALGSLGTGASADACGNDWADAGTRDTDWFEVTVVDSDGDGQANVTVTLTSEIPTAAFLISGATGDCAATNILPDIALSDDCISATFTSCIPAGTYTVFVGTTDAAGGSIFSGFPCTSLEVPFDYTITVSVDNATCSFCGDGVCDPGEDCSCLADCVPAANEGAGTCNDGIDNDCDGSIDCTDADCVNIDGCPAMPIPTMSEWGVLAMIMLLLAAGTIVFARRRTASA